MRILVQATNPTGELGSWIGGNPMGPQDMPWPYCRSCEEPMQFLAQIDLTQMKSTGILERDEWLLLFECLNNPGMCEEWDADSGGNAALLVSRAGAVRLEGPPSSEDMLLPGFERLAFADFDTSGFCSEKEAYSAALRQAGVEVSGKLGGQPMWIEDDETPRCQCGEAMRFAVQLEEGSELYFGGGWGLAFICDNCQDQAKFLWQQ